MENPRSLTTVAPSPHRCTAVILCSCHPRRPGPVCSGVDGILQQCSINGSVLPADHFSVSSRHVVQLYAPALSAPGRTISGAMGDPGPPAAVEQSPRSLILLPLSTGHLSRPGPACSSGEGVSQPATAGEYLNSNAEPLPLVDAFPDSSFVPASTSPCTELHVDTNLRLRVYYQNVRGLRTKIDDLYLASLDQDYDVIVLTETWLNGDILSLQLFGTGYEVYCCDRDLAAMGMSQGGGAY